MLTQELVDQVPAGGTLVLPEGTFPAPSEPILRDSPLTIVGAGMGATVIDARTSLGSLIDTPAARGGTFVLSDFSVLGPEQTPVQTPGVLGDAMFRWVRAKTDTGAVHVSRVCVTGLYDAPVYRAGGGLLTVDQCVLNAFEAPVKFFGSQGERGHLSVTDSHLSGHQSKVSSIGIYIHPSLSAAIVRTTFENFGRYGFYHNGNPQSDGATTTIADCDFVDCDIIRAAKLTHPILTRCTNTGRTSSGGTLIEHGLTLIDCDLSGYSPLTFTAAPHHFRAIGCHFTPHNHTMMLSGSGRFEFVGCEWDLNPRGDGDSSSARAIRSGTLTGAAIEFSGCDIRDHHNDNFLLGVAGTGTISWAHTRVHTNLPPAGPQPLRPTVNYGIAAPATFTQYGEFTPVPV